MEGQTQEELECPSVTPILPERTSVTYRLPVLVSMCTMSPTLRNGQVSQQYTGCHKLPPLRQWSITQRLSSQAFSCLNLQHLATLWLH
jgi:hypothetical protein